MVLIFDRDDDHDVVGIEKIRTSMSAPGKSSAEAETTGDTQTSVEASADAKPAASAEAAAGDADSAAVKPDAESTDA